MSKNEVVGQYLEGFSYLDQLKKTKEKTHVEYLEISGITVPKYTNEFWTSKQRKAASIHEVSYRACFKPQLPRFFIELFTKNGDVVYDPFSGRGTTAIEAGLLGRKVIANDVNPLSTILAKPRFFPPAHDELFKKLKSVEFTKANDKKIDLSMFYHPVTFSEILSLRNYLAHNSGEVEEWIRMVATNRLTGHSRGFFSVYTLPPNQAVSKESQIKINEKRKQKPAYRDVKKLILKKSKSLLKNLTAEQVDNLKKAGKTALFLTNDARSTPEIKNNSVQLTVTSPPFLDIVQYSKDNWLRCWFNDLDDDQIAKKITMAKKVEEWNHIMKAVFKELFRITKPKGWVAFEVGEVRNGRIKLDENIVPIGISEGFKCVAMLINKQNFTKTSNIWGVGNNSRGTNTNRIVLFQK